MRPQRKTAVLPNQTHCLVSSSDTEEGALSRLARQCLAVASGKLGDVVATPGRGSHKIQFRTEQPFAVAPAVDQPFIRKLVQQTVGARSRDTSCTSSMRGAHTSGFVRGQKSQQGH